MPHSSRKKRPPTHQKRRQVTDDNGWTHITTGQNARKALRQTAIEAQGGSDSSSSDREKPGNHYPNNDDIIEPGSDNGGGGPVRLVPAESPRGLTLEELAAQFQRYRATWENSSTWSALRDALQRHGQRWRRRWRERQRQRRRGTTADTTNTLLDRVSRLELEDETTVVPSNAAASTWEGSCSSPNIVCLGLGSLSGLLRGGWVDRRNVSLYQLAALVSIIEFFGLSDTHPDTHTHTHTACTIAN